MSASYSIQALASEFGLTARAIRYYEQKGLLKPARRGRTRVFSDRDRTRLRLVLRGRRLGFTLDECKKIIELYNPDQPNDQRQLVALWTTIREHRAQLLDKLKDIEETLSAMDRVEKACQQSWREAIGGAAGLADGINVNVNLE